MCAIHALLTGMWLFWRTLLTNYYSHLIQRERCWSHECLRQLEPVFVQRSGFIYSFISFILAKDFMTSIQIRNRFIDKYGHTEKAFDLLLGA